MLTVTTEQVDDLVILRCAGRIVCGDEAAILCPAIRHQGRNVAVDLSQVDAIDAAGLGALLSLQAAGVYLKLMNPTEAVRKTLRLTNLDSIFEICESTAGAVRADAMPVAASGTLPETAEVPVA